MSKFGPKEVHWDIIYNCKNNGTSEMFIGRRINTMGMNLCYKSD